MEHFIAVAEELSVRRAARRLHVVESGVSAAMRSLERELGCGLFERTSQQVRLTGAGAALLAGGSGHPERRPGRPGRHARRTGHAARHGERGRHGLARGGGPACAAREAARAESGDRRPAAAGDGRVSGPGACAAQRGP
ncbi:LysR family transcriptional regulator [Streptomyces sp. WAC07094]|uniref:helix-turn-helix domain-containing protein n=1 Tax=Streptomyces sp. WAC07094 TaxID=3072183 RepID=UPI002E9DA25A|nr:LysR family transcriptional regulator [Streptomyces sp. WAC07094]